MFMLQCDEYQESYDDEQNEIDWQFVRQYEEYMMMQQDDQWEWDCTSSEMDEDWLNHQEQFSTQKDYIDYLIQCNAID